MERISKIKDIDSNAMQSALVKWNNVAKPLHSLGILEEYIIRMAGIFGTADFDISKRCAVCMCADNGVVCEGVTQTDSSVTAIVAKAMAEGTSNINIMAKVCGADVFPVDVGINGDISCKGLLDRKIAYGTDNIAIGPAMTRENAEKAISVGMDMVKQCADNGYKIIVTGEMGIGNTTTASACTSALSGLPGKLTAGRGAGLDNEGLSRKQLVIDKAIEINHPDPNDPLDIISKVGGYDIAGMTGLFLGGAVFRIPVVADGFITIAAAVLASMFSEHCSDYIFASHLSEEPASILLMEKLNAKPPITAGMHLGEGTGGVLLLPMLDAAMAVYDSSHRFEELKMERYVDLC